MIVYFYPAALTPGCTTQAVDFTAAAGDLAEAGLDIIGSPPTSPEKLLRSGTRRSSASRSSPIPDKTVLKAYGAYGPKKLYGKEVVGVIRSTFIVDAEGRIEKRRLQRQGHRPRGQAAPRAGPRLIVPQWWATSARIGRPRVGVAHHLEDDQRDQHARPVRPSWASAGSRRRPVARPAGRRR